MRLSTLDWATILGGPMDSRVIPSLAISALPPVWSVWTWVLTIQRTGPSDNLRISAMALGASGAKPVSTRATPSLPVCTVMLPPSPMMTETLPWTWAVVRWAVSGLTAGCASNSVARSGGPKHALRQYLMVDKLRHRGSL